MVFYTEWIALVAVAFLWEVYDTFRLFWLPPAVVAGIRSVDLSRVLGAPENYEECLELLKVVTSTVWPQVNESNRRRTVPANSRDLCPTLRTDTGGDFIWYNPWDEVQVTRDEVVDFMKNRPKIPTGHPTGYQYFSKLPDVAWSRGSPQQRTQTNLQTNPVPRVRPVSPVVRSKKVVKDVEMEDLPRRGDSPENPPMSDGEEDEIQPLNPVGQRREVRRRDPGRARQSRDQLSQ